MIALNHAMTGAVIGLSVSNPVIAIITAVASHFICDAIPHFGSSASTGDTLASRWFARYLLIDAALCGVLVLVLAANQPLNWMLAAVCAFAAAAPDVMWLPDFLKRRRGINLPEQRSRWTKWAADIQWFEKPIGAVVEVAWFAGMATVLAVYL